jgi:DNA-binding IclR family transcriptional regulator
VQTVAVVEPSGTTFHVAYRVGSRHPLGVGAAGRAIGLRPGGKGWAAVAGELPPGGFGIAAPVRGLPGVRAAVGVLALQSLESAEVGPLVVTAATALAEALGLVGGSG